MLQVGDGASRAQRGGRLVPGLGHADSLGCLSGSFRGEAFRGARDRNLVVLGFVAG